MGKVKTSISFFLQIVMTLDDSGMFKRESVFLEFFKKHVHNMAVG
jgi:hypothetical protein